MQDRREKSHRMDTIRSEISHIRSYACAVTQTGYRTIRRDLIGRINHRHQFADGVFDFMFTTDTTIAKEIAAEVLSAGMHFIGPFIAIRHDQYHRLTEPFRYFRSERIQNVPFLQPRIFIAVDAVYQIQYRKRTFPLRYIYCYVPIEFFCAAIPGCMNNLRRCGDRIG